MAWFSSSKNSWLRWEDTQVITVQWNKMMEPRGGEDEFYLKNSLYLPRNRRKHLSWKKRGQENSRYKITETTCIWEWWEFNESMLSLCGVQRKIILGKWSKPYNQSLYITLKKEFTFHHVGNEALTKILRLEIGIRITL